MHHGTSTGSTETEISLQSGVMGLN